MNLIDRAIATRNDIEKLYSRFESGALEADDIDFYLKFNALRIKSEEVIYKIAMKPGNKSLPEGLNPKQEATT